MNWLVISDDKKYLDEAKDLISVKFKESIIYSSSSDSKELKEIIQILPEISHAVIFTSISKNPLLTYIAGFICGSDTQVYTSDEAFGEALIEFDLVQIFETPELLLEFIDEKSDEIIEENFQAEAYDYLYQNGYPFDADNFGVYISKWKKNICECYLASGMSPNARDKDGTPMLNIACRSDNLSAVKWLLNKGAELNGVSKDRGYTAIMDAVWRGNEDITKFLIRKGAELNTISKEGQTMLILAVGADKTEIVRMLAENGADPDIQDGMGMSAYGYAQLFKKEEILSILEKYHKEQ